jgi:hypothetical protein
MAAELKPVQVHADDRSEVDFVSGRRLWALLMIARTLKVATSILECRPVMARGLNSEPLRRALRAGRRPAPDEFVTVTHEMLDAIDEAGPLELEGQARR